MDTSVLIDGVTKALEGIEDALCACDIPSDPDEIPSDILVLVSTGLALMEVRSHL